MEMPSINKALQPKSVAQISISLPVALRTRIELAAKADRRNRSNFITTVLERYLDRKREESCGR